ncbi:uncharacterized protein LOC129320288 isoform X2 [Prosopis cineraria]|uniref:uncharacterized protein LOC129320288 isoform X2 n=1 Tax=Prosopis cineraria TaxID=364024 RepID=UPI0024109000|nr:uncharacterized protein LOC129320288 isoform X2 [Prosopis cineraria]
MSMPSPRLASMPQAPQPPDSWDFMLPSPPSRSNFGSADLSAHGLIAFPSGSSLSIVDSRSMQLLSSFPMPPPSATSSSSSSSSLPVSSIVTSVRWTPTPLSRDLLSSEPSSSHLLLAAGDCLGRIALLDFRLKTAILCFEADRKLGIQDLCWVQSHHDFSLLAAIEGPSTLSIYNTYMGRCIWKYDAYPEYFSCIRRDPFDSRHICAIGLKGFLLSVTVHGAYEDNVMIKEFQIPTESKELQKLEKDATSASMSPVSAVFPRYVARFAFSPLWRHILFVTFPRELIVFDLQYRTILFSSPLPRGCGKFLDVLPDPNNEWLYCAHLDGRLSTWHRKPGEQVHIMSSVEELMPSVGTAVPSPSVLTVLLCQSDSALQNICRSCSDVSSSFLARDFDSSFDFCEEPTIVSKTHLISISDDGKIWNWLLTTDGNADTQVNEKLGSVNNDKAISYSETKANTTASSTNPELRRRTEHLNGGRGHLSSSTFNQKNVTIKICLVGQLQVISSTVTMLAVPSPSLTASLARGGNTPAVAVPLVALGTQNGTIDLIDISANAVASSFSVHNGIVRGLRWLGNSRLVSFSYSQVSEKAGGYINKVVMTCLRSGLNKMFRVMQKPERAPIRALRASSSGRYLLILFRDAPVEVWAMTKNPRMLRSLALPFTVLEWTLPTVPRPAQSAAARQQLAEATDETSTPTKSSTSDSKGSSTEGSHDDTSESFSFALVNGALGVFEVYGRRIRDFRPRWPTASFVSSDGLTTAMAYRLPHVVMGDRAGNIRWWDVTTGHSSSFNTHREGILRIKFSPFIPGDSSRGRVAVLFYDNTFSIFDLDSPDPLNNSFLQPQCPETLALELDWLPLRTNKNDPLMLCIAGSDSSFRLVEINVSDKRLGYSPHLRPMKERFRPMPLCCPILLPTPHALALRMILQLGVEPSWFNTSSTTIKKRPHFIPGASSSSGDLRTYMIDLPPLGDTAVPEMLLKILEPYQKEGCILDDERAKLYASVVNKGCAIRFAFAAAMFGESPEALFWLQLPKALKHLMNKLFDKPPSKGHVPEPFPEVDETSMLSRITSKGKPAEKMGTDAMCQGQLRLMAFDQKELWEGANERISWHENLEGEEVIQNRVHELVSVGNLEVAVSLLLSTPPESYYFYLNALRAVALSSTVSRSLHELAVKVVAANMVRADRSLTGTHLLCAVGRYQEACSQLQDAGCWMDASTLAASHLKGSDYARVLQRWAGYVLRTEHNIWRALILFVAAGALQEALAALREAQLPETAAMFILACHEIHSEIIASFDVSDDESPSFKENLVHLPGLDPRSEDVIAVGEYFGQYQRKLVHLCMDSPPFFD